MSLEFYLAYVFACFVVVIVPGPTVTLIVANSMTYGSRAGLINIAGTQLGLAVMMLIVLLGLASLIETMGVWFDWVRMAGAAYLVWLGIRLLMSPGAIGDPARTKRPRMGFFWQGFLVLMSNPKALLVFGAFIPQFVDAKVVAGIFDSAYAILAGRAREVLSPPRVRLISRLSGGFLIGGGVWLALARTR
jgi:threonine/homoserine/homoserine lactone efflux protein